MSYAKQPCPGRMLDDVGSGFAMGCLGGAVMYFFKGITLNRII
jgi:hypothetical protein